MSRATDVLNDLELAAKKLGMSIEEAVSILLGTHKTHVVVQQHAAEPQPEAPAAEGNAAPAGETQSPGSSTEAGQTASGAASASADTPQPEAPAAGEAA